MIKIMKSYIRSDENTHPKLPNFAKIRALGAFILNMYGNGPCKVSGYFTGGYHRAQSIVQK
jgi:hypothetical protein